MSRTLVVMLDLEQTIIDSWNSCMLLPRKIAEIKRHIKSHVSEHYAIPIIEYGIFSFAVDRQDEKAQARNIGTMAGFNLIDNDFFIPCWTELEELVGISSPSIQKWEIVNMFGKDKMFDLWTRQRPGVDFLLFDDCLPDKKSITVRDGQTITKIRV